MYLFWGVIVKKFILMSESLNGYYDMYLTYDGMASDCENIIEFSEAEAMILAEKKGLKMVEWPFKDQEESED